MENKKSKPLREWMNSVKWPDNAPDWSSLGKIDCISLEEALSMIASTSSMPITTRRYYKGAFDAVSGLIARNAGSGKTFKAYNVGYSLGLEILKQRLAAIPPEMPLPETLHDASYISVAPSDYERMCRRDAQWGEMIEKLRTLSGVVADLVLKMEKLK